MPCFISQLLEVCWALMELYHLMNTSLTYLASSQHKCTDFNTIFTYLGFLWDLVTCSVSLPESKCLKYLAKLNAILESLSKSPFLSFKEVLCIHGTLFHVAFVIPHGHAFLSNLSHFTSLFPYKAHFVQRKPPPSIINNLKWW
jgi:hypothetical protein